MKKLLSWVLLIATMFSLCSCGSDASPLETTEAKVETATLETQAVTVETEPSPLEGSLFLKVSSITFSLVGESDDIYLGLIPRELVTWESEDPSIVSVENGVLTATGVGTTTIRATYYDRQAACTAGCLAETREELDSLAPEVLSAPKRMPPEVDMEKSCTYFDNAAIIGDSITYFLWQSESQNNYLGNLSFVTRQGISILGLVKRYKNLYFEGREMLIEDIAAQCKSERIYLALGCLDFQFAAGRDSLMESWNTMLDRIAEKRPDLEVVIISNIPSFTENAEPSEINDFIAETNVQLRELAEEKGYGFLDLGYYVQDHCGRMPAVYSKDDYHMNDEGSLAWMRIMRYYAQYEHEGGTLLPSGGQTEQTAAAEAAAPETAVMEVSAGEEQPTTQAAELPVLDAHLFLKASSVTFSLVGESEDIYLGLVPRELVTWESDDPSIVSVENGVLTANSVGTTTIRATYYDQQATCTAGCLAETQEELDSLGFEVLSQPKRLLPEVDLEVPCTYFENAALVGDSISYMMLQCESKGDYLGNLLFLTRGGTSLNGFVRRFKNIYYQGREMNLEDAIAASGVERMYILIGSNDLASDPQREVFFENWDIILGRIREKSPDVEIVLISNIPQYASESEQNGFFRNYNANVAEYNGKMRQYAAENNCLYLDLCYYIQDHCGRMAKEYNLDGYHLNEPGYQTWMKVLRYYAQYELEGGTLS